MRFDWEKFMDKDNKIAVHCKTQEEANDFCKKMDEHGLMWCNNNSYFDDNYWDDYKEEMCYTNYGEYSSLEFYRDEAEDKHEILEWSDYKTFTKSDMLNGYVCELRDAHIGLWSNGNVVSDKFDRYNYNEDLTNEYRDIEDIIKVTDCYGKVIWERVEKEDVNKKEWEFVDECKTTFTIAPNNNYGYIGETNEPIMFDLESKFDKRVAVGLSIDQAKQIISALTEIVEFVEK